MPLDQDELTITPDNPGTEKTKGGEHIKILIVPPDDSRRHVQRDEAKGRACPPWRSHGCEHGSRSHRIAPDGSVQEIVDLAPTTTLRRKPKAISSRQRTER
jgi:hypothetical protein